MLTVGAIAKNEGKYIVEWLAYHLAIGVDRFIIFSNESEDDQIPLLRKIAAADARVTVIDWPSPLNTSPQIAAYRHALTMISTEWVAFFDIDEYLVPTEHLTIRDYLKTVPADVGSIHVNWRNFGSGNLIDPNYSLVTRAFMQGAPLGWSNHHHFKSIARAAFVTDVGVHNLVSSQGRRALSDFSEFETINGGMSSRVIHAPLRLHHYQSKTFAEFSARMRRGDANFPPGHPDRSRDESESRFKQIDLNDVYDNTIRRFDKAVDMEVARLSWILSSGS
ncbi:glycosyltransferase family 92 protein [Rhizobium lusitanum]|uniref:Glycosyltransferase family 92 n=1 Tax=Rhizobium lusitanum TaxID=293958 RepID=A0A1C3UT11_9HYPH|nr:glycosyltransferase family 92 protein [Rhizobium lusitanum]SCB18588.1 Glycosyltransferase family 92 [Rhizobium lusitanum]